MMPTMPTPDTAEWIAAARGAIKSAKTPEDARNAAIAVLKPRVFAAREAVWQRFENRLEVEPALAAHTAVIDGLMQVTLALAMEAAGPMKTPAAIAVIAVGGYGRGQLFPHSDIDIALLYEGKKPANIQAIAEWVLYALWDMGLKVGHAVREIKECVDAAQKDHTIATGLLDARHVTGNAKIFDTFIAAFRKDIANRDALPFVEAKLNEREIRHHRHGDSRYILEPNIKDGKGGLRDLHTLYWMLRYTHPALSAADALRCGVLSAQEIKAFESTQGFLSLVRALLHRVAGRVEERLTFDMQRAVGEKLGYHGQTGPRSLEHFMRRYFVAAKVVGGLTRQVCAALEDERQRAPRAMLGAILAQPERFGPFVREGERLNIADANLFKTTPAAMLDLFHTAQVHGLDIHPRALRAASAALSKITRAVQEDAAANATFLSILLHKNAETTLRRMNEAGVLGKFIPDFGRVVGRMQYDGYHTYTVDEHTIHAIGMLHAIERGQFKTESPIASTVVHQLVSRRVLYLAMLCHDIAKGRGGDHSELGEKIARELAARFGFSAAEQDTTGWLVRQHLLMTMTAFKRDIGDPETIRQFVAEAQSPERLRLLLILTVADIRAVGPAIWNGWKGALLRDLYLRAEAMMGASMPTITHPDQRGALAAALHEHLPKLHANVIEDYLDLGTPAYWSKFTDAEHAAILQLLRRYEQDETAVATDLSHHEFLSVSRLLLVTPDQHGLFSKMAGALALAAANITEARIHTLKNGMAVEAFGIQSAAGKCFDTPEKITRMQKCLNDAAQGKLALEKELAKATRQQGARTAHRVPPAVFIDNTASQYCTVVEVNGHDRSGFLYHVTRALADLGLNITTAHISTYGNRVVDVFYVKDVFGMKIYNEHKLRQVEERLLGVLSPTAKSSKAA